MPLLRAAPDQHPLGSQAGHKSVVFAEALGPGTSLPAEAGLVRLQRHKASTRLVLQARSEQTLRLRGLLSMTSTDLSLQGILVATAVLGGAVSA